MTWLVKVRSGDGKVDVTHCDDPNHALDILNDRLQRGSQGMGRETFTARK